MKGNMTGLTEQRGFTPRFEMRVVREHYVSSRREWLEADKAIMKESTVTDLIVATGVVGGVLFLWWLARDSTKQMAAGNLVGATGLRRQLPPNHPALQVQPRIPPGPARGDVVTQRPLPPTGAKTFNPSDRPPGGSPEFPPTTPGGYPGWKMTQDPSAASQISVQPKPPPTRQTSIKPPCEEECYCYASPDGGGRSVQIDAGTAVTVDGYPKTVAGALYYHITWADGGSGWIDGNCLA